MAYEEEGDDEQVPVPVRGANLGNTKKSEDEQTDDGDVERGACSSGGFVFGREQSQNVPKRLIKLESSKLTEVF